MLPVSNEYPIQITHIITYSPNFGLQKVSLNRCYNEQDSAMFRSYLTNKIKDLDN